MNRKYGKKMEPKRIPTSSKTQSKATPETSNSTTDDSIAHRRKEKCKRQKVPNSARARSQSISPGWTNRSNSNNNSNNTQNDSRETIKSNEYDYESPEKRSKTKMKKSNRVRYDIESDTEPRVVRKTKKGDESPISEDNTKSCNKDSVSLVDNMDTRGTIKMKFQEFAQHTQKKSVEELKEEFEQLPGWPEDHECAAFYLKTNSKKNRYTDIRCLDASRVRLTFLATGEAGSDYIHANYVSSKHLKHSYILTQGPKQVTILDFWRMVWQEKVVMIAMLCNFMENDREKCVEYYPRGPKTFKLEKDFALYFETSTKDGPLVTTKLTLMYRKEKLQVTHIQWLGWPDYNVPDSSQVMLKVLQKLKEAKSTPIIHCAAGIGRSGTLIAVQIALAAFATLDSIPDVEQIVKHLRLFGRCGAVQTPEQYMLIRKVLLDYAVASNYVTKDTYNKFSDCYFKMVGSMNRST